MAPEEAGSSPAGHPIAPSHDRARDLEISEVSYALPAGSIPALATIARTDLGPVAQLEAHLPCKEEGAGSNPARSTQYIC